jgi:hypothetical protein
LLPNKIFGFDWEAVSEPFRIVPFVACEANFNIYNILTTTNTLVKMSQIANSTQFFAQHASGHAGSYVNAALVYLSNGWNVFFTLLALAVTYDQG